VHAEIAQRARSEPPNPPNSPAFRPVFSLSAQPCLSILDHAHLSMRSDS
jgi:hypothetical protein